MGKIDFNSRDAKNSSATKNLQTSKSNNRNIKSDTNVIKYLIIIIILNRIQIIQLPKMEELILICLMKKNQVP